MTLSGGSWSTALLPLALLMLATAVAALAVRGWPLRALAGLLAVASLAVGYLGVSLWVVPDVAARGADLAHISLVTLVGSERRYWGAGVAVVAAVCTLIAAVLLMRSATSARDGATKICRAGDPPVDCATQRRRRGDAGGAGDAGDVGADDLGRAR